MKKKKLVIYDEKIEYVERLVSELNKKNTCIFFAEGYSEFELFKKHISETKPEVILTSKEIKIENDILVIKLNNSQGEEGVFKFQSVSKILDDILRIYCEKNSKFLSYEGVGKAKFKVVISLFDSLKSILYVFNSLKNDKEKTLLVPLSAVCQLEMLYDKNSSDILDCIYYSGLENGISVEQLSSLIKIRDGVSFIPASESSIEFNTILPEEWEILFEQLIYRSGFDNILFYLGVNIAGFVNFIKEADEATILVNNKDEFYNSPFNRILRNKGVGENINIVEYK